MYLLHYVICNFFNFQNRKVCSLLSNYLYLIKEDIISKMIQKGEEISVLKEITDEKGQNTLIHDLCFDFTGKRLGIACSDKTVRVYLKYNGEWVKESQIKIFGASVTKVKWARPEFGIYIATASLDRQVRIYQWKRVEKLVSETYQWVVIHNQQAQNRSIEDIKFAPFHDQGLSLAYVTAQGQLKVIQPNDSMKIKSWQVPVAINLCQLGLNCLSWGKNKTKEQMIIAVGCKSLQTTHRRILNGIISSPTDQPKKLEPPSTTLAFVTFNKNKQLTKINHSIKEKDSINDISFALMNGRSYYLIAIATDSGIKIFELNFRDQSKSNSVEVIKQINLSNTTSFRELYYLQPKRKKQELGVLNIVRYGLKCMKQPKSEKSTMILYRILCKDIKGCQLTFGTDFDIDKDACFLKSWTNIAYYQMLYLWHSLYNMHI